MQPPDRFETERLHLRPADVGDAEALFDAYAGDPRATRYLSWPTHETASETRDFLADAQARWRDGSECIWVLQPHAHPTPVGALGTADTPHGIEFGYVLGHDWWGRGLMTEALGPVLAWLRAQPDVHRVWAYCAVDHVRSARVLERSGMTYEATLRRWVVLPNISAVPCDAHVYSWIREDR